MPSKSEGIGALDYPNEEREALAKKSHSFKCSMCGVRCIDALPARPVGVENSRVAETASPYKVECDDVPRAAEPNKHEEETPHGEELGDQGQAGTSGGQGEGARDVDSVPVDPEVDSTRIVSIPGQADALGENRHGAAESLEGALAAAASRRRSETELLYVAYALGFLILLILARRLVWSVNDEVDL